MYTERLPEKVAQLLNWKHPAKKLGPVLVIPYPDLYGDVMGTPSTHARVRTWNEELGKYQQPTGVSPRAYFPPAAREAVRDHPTFLLITEGELKALAGTQAGIPTIGIPGGWTWMQGQHPEEDGQPKGERKLIPDLEGINWKDRPVGIVFDRDGRRNPGMNHSAAELARVLTRAGADVEIFTLPLGPLDAEGNYQKQGLDDYIIRDGPERFRALLRGQWVIPEYRPLADYRKDMRQRREDSLKRPGLYLDTGPTGSGKSHADAEVVGSRERFKSLTIVPTHKNCDQVVRQFKGAAAAYPPLDRNTCRRYEEAIGVVNRGLSVHKALCPHCPHRRGCAYLEGHDKAKTAQHSVATHRRAEMSTALMEGRDLVAIHEIPHDLLRPLTAISKGFTRLRKVVKHVHDNTRDPDRRFYRRMHQVAGVLRKALESAKETDTVPLPGPADVAEPRDLDSRLWQAMQNLEVSPPGDVVRVIKAACAGKLAEVVVKVEHYYSKGSEEKPCRSLVAVWKNDLPSNCPVWINDASADAEDIKHLAGREVINATPEGRLRPVQDCRQLAYDVTKRTAPHKVLGVLHSVLRMFPEYQQVGVITHLCHVPLLRGEVPEVKAPEFLGRLAMLDHFRGGNSRGSNDWIEKCDFLVVLGTPRVPESAVRNELIRRGKTAATKRSKDEISWTYDYWSGWTDDRKLMTVRTRGYRDHDWHETYTALVRSELIQSQGRGRTILEEGIPVVMVTTENLGLTLLDVGSPWKPLSDEDLELLQVMEGLMRDGDGDPLNTGDIVSAAGKSRQKVTDRLNSLRLRRYIRKRGRGEWVVN
jgi:hypothetical protein